MKLVLFCVLHSLILILYEKTKEENMNKFLLIDDENSRLGAYKELFNFVEIEYMEDASEFTQYMEKNYDGYIIDVMLDGRNSYSNNYMTLSFESVIDRIPYNKPIFIVSRDWQEVVAGDAMRILVQSEKYKNILVYFSWDLIEKGEIELYRNFSKTQLNNFEGIRIHEIGQDEDFTILQISDLEFGNPEQYDFIKASERELIRLIRMDLSKLAAGKQKVDMIAVCGDITYTGAREQYTEAAVWLKDFCSQILKGSIEENVIFVPGNHDFNISSTLENYYYYDFLSKQIKEREEIINEYDNLGLMNYFRFVYEFTGNNQLLLNPKHYYINKSLKDANIVFVQIFPIRYMTKTGKFEYILSDDDLYAIEQELKELSDIVTCIIVSHVSYQVVNMLDATSGVTSGVIEDFINRANIKIWMYGHAHARARIDDIDIGGHKRLISNSDALLLNPVARCPNSDGGYTLMNFKRKDGKIIAVEYMRNNMCERKEQPFLNK